MMCVPKKLGKRRGGGGRWRERGEGGEGWKSDKLCRVRCEGRSSREKHNHYSRPLKKTDTILAFLSKKLQLVPSRTSAKRAEI